MATAKKAPAKKKPAKPKKETTCWAGYEPVPGKTPGSKGSCKPKSK